jgi:hypothetical protein
MTADKIASRRPDPYLGDMLSLPIRLLTLLALVAMPFAMAASPAQAHSGPDAMAGMSAEHCADHEDSNAPPATDMTQCLLMCAALPAMGPLRIEPPELPRAPLALSAAVPIHGIILEIATPPPRLA